LNLAAEASLMTLFFSGGVAIVAILSANPRV